MTDLTDVGAVIVTYNSQGVISDCLAGLPAGVRERCVIVDNASTDGTLAIVRSAEAGTGPRILHLATNIGFGAAVNRGSRELGDPRYLLVLNPDAVIGAANLQLLVDYLDAHESCAVVAPRLWRDGTPLQSARRAPSRLSELWPVAPAFLARRLPARGLPPDYDVEGPVDAVEGACMLIRGATFRALGGFDEGYFLFFEELDLAKRLQQRRLTCDLCPEARADHLVGHSRGQVPFAAADHFVTSTLRYLRKWHKASWARGYVGLARPSWWLRSHLGGMDPELARGLRAAVRSPRARP